MKPRKHQIRKHQTRKHQLIGLLAGAAALVTLTATVTACRGPQTARVGAPSNPAGSSAPAESPSASAAAATSPSVSASPKKGAEASQKAPNSTATFTVSGFPTAADTGYPHGLAGDSRKAVTLTPYSGPSTITVNGTVIDGKDVNGGLTINAKNVTIKNSRIRATNSPAITSRNGDANLMIVDTELDGQGKDSSTGGIALIGQTGFTLLRVNAHDSGDIVRLDGRATIQDSWLHDPSGTNGAQHNDTIQSTNATFIRILHNRIENPHVQTSCILLKADLGSISDVLVDSNLFNGGGYTFYWYDSNDKSNRITNGKVVNNRWLRSPGGGFFAKGGNYGPVATSANELPQWTNNAWEDNGQAISL
jgi:hypothetical protein